MPRRVSRIDDAHAKQEKFKRFFVLGQRRSDGSRVALVNDIDPHYCELRVHDIPHTISFA